MKKLLIITFCLIFKSIFSQELPKGFTYLRDIAPSIQHELRYCTHNNFIGIPIDGYEESAVICTLQTAKALQKVQKEVQELGFSLKIFDAYRPQQAVNHFVRWARILNDTVKKQQFYPEINKRHLFKLGYIASKSGHSRGSTVDLTLVNTKTDTVLDMGSPYDFFGIASHVTYSEISPTQRKNRLLLRKVMLKNGFRPYENEWWHFTLNREPFPNTYFDFPVR